MDANELRALQAPLKKQYREQPATALTPARAEAMLDVDRIACRVRSWGGETDAGLHPAPAMPHNIAQKNTANITMNGEIEIAAPVTRGSI